MAFNLPNLSSVFHPITNDRENNGRALDDFFYDLERRVPHFSSSKPYIIISSLTLPSLISRENDRD